MKRVRDDLSIGSCARPTSRMVFASSSSRYVVPLVPSSVTTARTPSSSIAPGQGAMWEISVRATNSSIQTAQFPRGVSLWPFTFTWTVRRVCFPPMKSGLQEHGLLYPTVSWKAAPRDTTDDVPPLPDVPLSANLVAPFVHRTVKRGPLTRGASRPPHALDNPTPSPRMYRSPGAARGAKFPLSVLVSPRTKLAAPPALVIPSYGDRPESVAGAQQ
jgi:hypothetical protein